MMRVSTFGGVADASWLRFDGYPGSPRPEFRADEACGEHLDVAEPVGETEHDPLLVVILDRLRLMAAEVVPAEYRGRVYLSRERLDLGDPLAVGWRFWWVYLPKGQGHALRSLW